MEQNGYQYSENLPPKKEDGHKFIKGALLGALLVCLVIAAGNGTGIRKDRSESAGRFQRGRRRAGRR